MRDFETSYYLPPKVFTNREFFKTFPQVNPSNYQKLGITKRHIVEPGYTASDLAVSAAEQLFDEYPALRGNVGHLIFCGQEMDYYTPATSCVVQSRLNLDERVSALDINHGCSGFAYGLFLAKGMLASGSGSNGVLFTTGTTLSRKLNAKDPASRFVFGDAGTATYISARFISRLGKSCFRTLGKSFESIIIEDGQGRNPENQSSLQEVEDRYGNISAAVDFRMDGMRVFSFSMRIVPELVDEVLEINQVDQSEIDYFIFHQANAFILSNLARKMKIPVDKVIIDLEDTGNTGQCSIPIVLKKLDRKGLLQGKKVLILGFGTGLSAAGTIVDF